MHFVLLSEEKDTKYPAEVTFKRCWSIASNAHYHLWKHTGRKNNSYMHTLIYLYPFEAIFITFSIIFVIDTTKFKFVANVIQLLDFSCYLLPFQMKNDRISSILYLHLTLYCFLQARDVSVRPVKLPQFLWAVIGTSQPLGVVTRHSTIITPLWMSKINTVIMMIVYCAANHIFLQKIIALMLSGGFFSQIL